ncbi:hypothetical protein HanHA300_Chr01g0025481 [Helianthus annuus]|nr:hypothetical protein HanHA300_Chr01g0025481 [Helianthus annuus]KAJ0783896.1 hypothetical protein HanLR1_Chr01g0026161 [Helianthus annuus]
MLQLDEKALMAVGMSMLCVPKNLRPAPIYAYKGKGKPCWLLSFTFALLYDRLFIKISFAAYRLINALDPKIGGEMIGRILPEGELPWLEQIRDYFHHPTVESLSVHVAIPTGMHPSASVKPEVVQSPAQGETILLSSEESTASSNGLIHRSRATREGPQERPSRSDGAGVATDPVTMEPKTPAHESVPERPEAQSRPGVQTGKHSSNLHYLNYVVVSDTLSGLDLGVKRTATEIEEDQATITQIMEKKRKLLSDTKHKLDTEAALDVSEEKRKLMGQPVGSAPSESEVDLSVFRKKIANILDDLYEDSAGKEGSARVTSLRSRRSISRGSKPIAVDISSIPAPESPPAVIFGESPVKDPVCPEYVKRKGPEGFAKSGAA